MGRWTVRRVGEKGVCPRKSIAEMALKVWFSNEFKRAMDSEDSLSVWSPNFDVAVEVV